MSNPNPTNFAASAYAKLKNIADQNSLNFMQLLIRYGMERFLYRLSVSDYSNQFVLKGGNLFIIWQNNFNYRPTVDADMLCFGKADADYLREVFIAIAQSEIGNDDGMRFDIDSMQVTQIRKNTEYGGTRFAFNGYLTSARIPLQFDIGIGDAITPPPELAEYPVLIGGPIPRLRIYPMATSIAEKTETLVSNGLINSRMKDFYDIWLLSELFNHDFATLKLAIANTFNRRNVPLPTEVPDALQMTFATNPAKRVQWEAFRRKNKLNQAPEDFSVVVDRLAVFLLPMLLPPSETPAQWIAAQGWQ